jgi:hypothetical protein
LAGDRSTSPVPRWLGIWHQTRPAFFNALVAEPACSNRWLDLDGSMANSHVQCPCQRWRRLSRFHEIAAIFHVFQSLDK